MNEEFRSKIKPLVRLFKIEHIESVEGKENYQWKLTIGTKDQGIIPQEGIIQILTRKHPIEIHQPEMMLVPLLREMGGLDYIHLKDQVLFKHAMNEQKANAWHLTYPPIKPRSPFYHGEWGVSLIDPARHKMYKPIDWKKIDKKNGPIYEQSDVFGPGCMVPIEIYCVQLYHIEDLEQITQAAK